LPAVATAFPGTTRDERTNSGDPAMK